MKAPERIWIGLDTLEHDDILGDWYVATTQQPDTPNTHDVEYIRADLAAEAIAKAKGETE